MKLLSLTGLLLLLSFVGRANSPTWGDPFPGTSADAKGIHGFVGDYKWLSNFFPCTLAYDGFVYQSSEAAYQASKFPASEREAFTKLDADSAKKLAHSKTADTPEWNARKDRVMREILWAKFTQNPGLGKQLLATGERILEETNWWNDQYWGVYQGKGRNELGLALMETRERLGRSATGSK